MDSLRRAEQNALRALHSHTDMAEVAILTLPGARELARGVLSHPKPIDTIRYGPPASSTMN